MNKFKFYFILLFIALGLFSCNKNDDGKIAPPRDYSEQYVTDAAAIEEYLKTHSIEKVIIDGLIDVKITKIPDPNTNGLVSIWDNTEFPLKSIIVKNDGRITNLVGGEINDPVEYKLYYIMLNEGGGNRPATVDSVLTSYRGWRISDNTEFDRGSSSGMWSTFPVVNSGESAVISGYRQFVSLLKTADGFSVDPDGTVSYVNAGVGVVFIPSGLGYYNNSLPKISAYSNIAFTIRLNRMRTRDHDRDGVLTINEDINGDGNFYNDDTDGDKIPDFLDIDDDNDNYLTSGEIKMDNDGTKNYPFDQIPNCQGTTGGLKRHLDPSCHRNAQ